MQSTARTQPSVLSALPVLSALCALLALCALVTDTSTANTTSDPLLPTEEARRSEQLRTLQALPLDAELESRPETSASAWMAAMGVILLGGGLVLLRRRRTTEVAATNAIDARVESSTPIAIAPTATSTATPLASAPPLTFAAALEPAVRVTNTDDVARLAALEGRIAELESSLLQVVESFAELTIRIEARLERWARKERRARRAAREQSQARPPVIAYEQPTHSAAYASSASAASAASVRPVPFLQEERPAVPRFDGPWNDPLASTPAPAPAASSAPELASRDPRQARELVMGLVRRGYDRAQIQAETRLPVGDVALILTSLRQPSAETATETATEPVTQPFADRAAESARFGR